MTWYDWLTWFYESTQRSSNLAFLILGGTMLLLMLIAIAIGKSRSSRKHEGTHGTAHFATREEVIDTGLIPRDRSFTELLFESTLPPRTSVYCGGYDDQETGRTQYLRHYGPEHVAVFAPTGSGKGVGLVIPTLLSWLESVFVLDIKGENDATTSGWRKKHANNVVLRFDPSEKGSCSWNALAEVRVGTDYQISDAQNIALMVIDSDGKGLNDHWRKAAWELLSGMILHSLYKAKCVGRDPCLKDCADMLTGTGDFSALKNEEDDLGYNDQGALMELFTEMQSVPFDPMDNAAVVAAAFIKGCGRSMANKPPKERDSVISTASNELALYRDNVVGENTSCSDFKVSDLMDHDKPVSLYFITTPANLLRLRPLIRLLLTRIVVGLTGKMEFDAGRSITMHKHPLLLMLDEFPSLGKLDIFESALAYIRGYGIKAYIICQDIQQLYQAYGPNQSITSNCHIRIAYAPTELKTAEMLSKMTGLTTIINEQISTSGKRFAMLAGQYSSSFHSNQRPLMTADEIQRLPLTTKDKNGNPIPGEMLIFVAGQPVIKGRQILYFLDPTFNARSKIKPPMASDSIRSAIPNASLAGLTAP